MRKGQITALVKDTECAPINTGRAGTKSKMVRYCWPYCEVRAGHTWFPLESGYDRSSLRNLFSSPTLVARLEPTATPHQPLEDPVIRWGVAYYRAQLVL
jgi:hypothetical protein